jgi:hypothetical protein
MVWDFHYALFTIHPLTFYCGWTMQNFVFFQFDHKFFFK